MKNKNLDTFGVEELSILEVNQENGGLIILGGIAAVMTIAYFAGYGAHMAYDYITE